MNTIGAKYIYYSPNRYFFLKRNIKWEIIHDEVKYVIRLIHSITSGKRKIYINNKLMKTYKKIFGGSVDKLFYDDFNFVITIKSSLNPFAEFKYNAKILDKTIR